MKTLSGHRLIDSGLGGGSVVAFKLILDELHVSSNLFELDSLSVAACLAA